MGANIGWLFYKDYFKNVDYSDLNNKRNEDDIKAKVQNIILQKPAIEEQNEDDILGNTHLVAITTYPGLLLGSGNAHELPSIEGQAILGFHFDYTSGLPVIQGSSIKGVLRSAFKHWEYIAEYTNLKTKDKVETLEKEIFDNGDIFHDASIIKADSFNKILGDDFLAPHGNNPLKNPIPLRFIKVLPNVTFRFDFDLTDTLITKEQKSQLFQKILEDLGLGAKTNVGYGKFENFSPFKTKAEKEQEEKEAELKKEQEVKEREQKEKELKEQKQHKAQEGLNALNGCKTFAEGLKILKESFTTAKPKLNDEQKGIVLAFAKRFEKQTKPKELKALKKYGVSL